MSKRSSIGGTALLAFALVGCADRPEVDQVAQMTMIGLGRRDVVDCLGEPFLRARPAQATEIWSYPVGVTGTDAPLWAVGTNFALLEKPEVCLVRVVLTAGRVSQVAYSLPDGRPLPTGRQCSFPVQACARVRQTL